MKAKRKSWYMDPEDLHDALVEAKLKGNEPTERVCRLFRTLAEHLTGAPRFSRYGVHDKEEMVSAALEKLIKNIKNYNPKYRGSVFSYCTRCAEQGFLAYLIKHYRFINQKRAAAMEMAAKADAAGCTDLAERLNEYVGDAKFPAKKKRRAGKKEKPGTRLT